LLPEVIVTRVFSQPNDDKPEIDQASVLSFFEKRAEKNGALGNICTVCYQDKNPALAERRDAAEKQLLFPKLDLDDQSRVLDAGCGVGRWAEAVIPACGFYHGVDVSPGLIQIAQSQFANTPKARFSVCSLDKMTMAAIGEATPFTHILSFGVFIYLNDEPLSAMLQRYVEAAAPKSRILMREPVAVQSRLTLKEHFSDDMDQVYNAVYRTEPELMSIFNKTLGSGGFSLADCGDVFTEQGLNNRAETKQRWFLWLRG
jgi:SAM-dependent methyltransferase